MVRGQVPKKIYNYKVAEEIFFIKDTDKQYNTVAIKILAQFLRRKIIEIKYCQNSVNRQNFLTVTVN